uniref:Uncharacterized protein n=1 Tax=Coprothermobacter proteolyticus (strain ATCC 35245 / DSM 5265 / OCM 4 / BT) TaxID=309798 RepID=B5Y8S9_COPPD
MVKMFILLSGLKNLKEKVFSENKAAILCRLVLASNMD